MLYNFRSKRPVGGLGSCSASFGNRVSQATEQLPEAEETVEGDEEGNRHHKQNTKQGLAGTVSPSSGKSAHRARRTKPPQTMFTMIESLGVKMLVVAILKGPGLGCATGSSTSRRSWMRRFIEGESAAVVSQKSPSRGWKGILSVGHPNLASYDGRRCRCWAMAQRAKS